MQKKGDFNYLTGAIVLFILLFITTTILAGPFGQVNDKKYSCDEPAICVENGLKCMSEGDGVLIPAGLCIMPKTKATLGTCCKSADQIEDELKNKVKPKEEGEPLTTEQQVNALNIIQIRLYDSNIPVLQGVSLKKGEPVFIYLWADSKNPNEKCHTYITTNDGKTPEVGSGFEDFSQKNTKLESCIQATKVTEHLSRTGIQKIEATPLKTGKYILTSLLKNELGEVISIRRVELNID